MKDSKKNLSCRANRSRGKLAKLILVALISFASIASWEIFLRPSTDNQAHAQVRIPARKSAAEKIAELIEVQKKTNEKLDKIYKKLDEIEDAKPVVEQSKKTRRKLEELFNYLKRGSLRIKK